MLSVTAARDMSTTDDHLQMERNADLNEAFCLQLVLCDKAKSQIVTLPSEGYSSRTDRRQDKTRQGRIEKQKDGKNEE